MIENLSLQDMNKYYLLTIMYLIVLAHVSQAQGVINGVVLDKSGKTSVPGATILIKGTAIGCSSNNEGVFQLLIPSDTATLVVTSVGYERRELRTKAGDTLIVSLKTECIVDFFYTRYIGVNYYGGALNSPIGGTVSIFYPHLLRYMNFMPAFRIEGGLQKGVNRNRQTVIKFDADEIFAVCDYNIALNFVYNNIELKKQNWGFISNKAYARIYGFPLQRTYLVLGGGHARFVDKESKRSEYGICVGLKKNIGTFSKYLFSFNASSIRWESCWQIQAGIEREFKKAVTSIEFNKVSNYSEVNLKVGYLFSY
ncbi:carboxypeptidase-like regulatory domain-containing protein [Hymenobacter busanensis]|uniref:Carboxypeptidase-like regulatory domain-containing protein n=1 Tax=Hymenobacter busanensis TaxID=2607656 RepID=A0A7L4ZVP5_9BACT|nr:carboxypeptidase-like regulatory domain-containing protein [Hymenobacter busanensis]KAA9339141.1 carboxypeptidase-like regulatory domain-containing protein [Hymenobacter busanensis]QHJ07097.1 hypothetical protein GUY19_07285 [Hymenobacter busanensis]